MKITSDDRIEIDEDFKVNAGPGAGKTHFIINHIKNILENSSKLSKTRKILCITYTNTSVETILHRLGKNTSNRVSVLTIHSFLYNYIVKPFASFLPEEFELNIKKMNGHDDIYINSKNIEKWLSGISVPFPQKADSIKQIIMYPSRKACLKKWLLSTRYLLEDGQIIINNKREFYDIDGIKLKKSTLDFLKPFVLDYFKYHWKNGVIFHDDVLFFSHTLLINNPFILDSIVAQFPYLIIDEYQDTSPIQSYIVDKIRERGSIVGVVGDIAQAIYSFQGANPQLFASFHVNDSRDYTIEANHRSYKPIVDFLNLLRADITQISHKQEIKGNVKILVGEKNKVFAEALNLSEDTNTTSLSRQNIVSNALKKALEDKINYIKTRQSFIETDSNTQRRRTIMQLIEAVEYARSSNFRDAIKKVEKAYIVSIDTKSKVLLLLQSLLYSYEQYSKKNLIEFHKFVVENLKIPLNGFRKGDILSFYESTLYENLAVSTNITDDISNHITIHKAKGTEFNSVVMIDGGTNKSFLLSPDLSKEEHRILYVAASRAKENLFIHFDELNSVDAEQLKNQYKMISIVNINSD